MITDQIADLVTRIRNASSAKHSTVVAPASKSKERILAVLQAEGYISSFTRVSGERNKDVLRITLKYAVDGQPAIKNITRVSRPGKRQYVHKDAVPVNREGLGIYLVSTSQGMLSDNEARKRGIGGEIICSVF